MTNKMETYRTNKMMPMPQISHEYNCIHHIGKRNLKHQI